MDISFRNRLTVVVGDNGVGKSTVLEAAAIAVGTFSNALGGLTSYGIRASDAHIKTFAMGSTLDVQPQFPVEISAFARIDGREVRWKRSLQSAKGRGSLAQAKELVGIAEEYQERMRRGDASLRLPLIAYYGTGRLWEQYREKRGEVFEKNNRSNGYIDSIEGSANNKRMMKWFQKMTLQELQRGKSIPEFSAVKGALERIYAAITGYEKVEIRFNLDTSEIDLLYVDNTGEATRISMPQLSDGYRTTLSLIADIAYRMAVLNPQYFEHVLDETDGVVLIDEIDLHLHPKWQKRILKDLLELFPKVQFIVSTHAPEVINSVKSESVIILNNKEALDAAEETFGKDANAILREVMDVSTRPDVIRMAFEEIYQTIDEGKWEEAERKIGLLEEEIGTNDAELNACRVRLASSP